MTTPIQSFADILAPVTPAEFFEQYWRRRPLHIPAPAADKLASVMSWQTLSNILSQSSLWSATSLQMVIDKRLLQPHEYSRAGRDRDNRETMLADFDKVIGWLRRGATLVCNDIDNLTPGLKATARALEEALTAKAQANLYCSWKAHQAFDVHFDTHDVYALHIAGEKHWKLYQCPIPDPIAHVAFKTLGQEFHDKNCGPVSMELVMKPGDVLYIPRGWYHDALAVSPGTFHIAFGVTSVIGLDLVGLLYEQAVLDPVIRQTMPPAAAGGGRDLEEQIARIGDRLAALARDPKIVSQFKSFVENFHYPRPSVELPVDALSPRFKVRAGLVVVQENGTWMLGDGRRRVPVPKGLETEVRWVAGRDGFAEHEFEAAFPFLAPAKRRGLLTDLAAMKVIEIA